MASWSCPLMNRVQVFLRAPLFSTRDNGHLPRRAMILDGDVKETGNGGITISVTGFRSEQGEELAGEAKTLFIPNSKVDHIWMLD